MLFRASRFVKDLRAVKGWVLLVGASSLVVSLLATYMAVFAAAEAGSGALSTRAPRDSLGFLRAIDPEESLVTVVDSPGDLGASVLDRPAMTVLLDHMARDNRMFLTLPADAFLQGGRGGIDVDSEVLAVMGAAPPFLTQVPRGGDVLVWGDVGDGSDPRRALRGHPLDRVASRPPSVDFVAGDGRRSTPSGRPAMVALDVDTGRDMGIRNPYDVSEVLRGFTCYCHAAELVDLATAMSEAELEAGTHRGYYAVTYDELLGPVERSRALTEMLNAGHAMVTFLGVWCLAVMATLVIWSRRSHTYLVERMAGSDEGSLHVRAQLLVALTLSLPAWLGYELVNAALATSAWPPPLPQRARLLALVLIAGLHALAGGAVAARIHRLCRHPRIEGRHA